MPSFGFCVMLKVIDIFIIKDFKQPLLRQYKNCRLNTK